MVTRDFAAVRAQASAVTMLAPAPAASQPSKPQEQGSDGTHDNSGDRVDILHDSESTSNHGSDKDTIQGNSQTPLPLPMKTDSSVTDVPPVQDAGDLGMNNLSIHPNQGTGNTNPFRKRSSRTATLVPASDQPGFWDEDADGLSIGTPEDLQDLSWNDTATSSTQVWSDELGGNNQSEPTAALGDMPDGGPVAQHGKGKAPMAAEAESSLGSSEDLKPSGISAERPQSEADRQNNEVYQIRHIRWSDGKCKDNLRSSPVLTQNANGPCPLLALVNALSLSTPAELITPFIDTLRTREQISLGLLLDAVFEELMSERRSGGNAADLPDVGELYSFLVTLHTGMNVNPRFVPSQKADGLKVGDFEDTREMKLYGTFNVPLIHGWIPHEHELARQAFARTASSYEDAQNVQFQGEDLRQKLAHGSPLKVQEQTLLEDVDIAKQFFTYWPTQLTAHGLDLMKLSVAPGAIFILFRNDHFSMVYKEPKSQVLFTLVTDAGYASHDEIVWESLVDINGSGSEWYSGDFRSVSHNQPVGEGGSSGDGGWTTVKSQQGRKDRIEPKAVPAPDNSLLPTHNEGRSTSEQEDLDLALALQLQEEEEERDRNEASQRRARENKLSREFIDQQSSTNPNGAVRVPPRRSAQAHSGVSRVDEGPDAPPPYEQAASSKPYRPLRDHASNEHAPRVHGSAYAQQAAALGQAAASPTARRRISARQSLASQMTLSSSGSRPSRLGRIETGMNSSHGDKEDKCTVM